MSARVVIDGTVYVPTESADGLADWVPLLAVEDLLPTDEGVTE